MTELNKHDMIIDVSGFYKCDENDYLNANNSIKTIIHSKEVVAGTMFFPSNYCKTPPYSQFEICQLYAFLSLENKNKAFCYLFYDFSEKNFSGNLEDSVEFFVRNSLNNGISLNFLTNNLFSVENCNLIIEMWERNPKNILSKEDKYNEDFSFVKVRQSEIKAENIIYTVNLYVEKSQDYEELESLESESSNTSISNQLKEKRREYYYSVMNGVVKNDPEIFDENYLFKENAFTAENDKLFEIKNAYKLIIDKYRPKDERTNTMIRTAIYAYLYANKNKDAEPYNYMSEITSAKKKWTYNENLYYTDSDFAKWFFTLYSYNYNELHPYTDLTRNSEMDWMNYNAMQIHNWMALNGPTEKIFNIFYGDNNNDGIYTILSRAKEVVSVLSDPLVIDPNSLSIQAMFTGIVSSIVNSALNILDSGVDSVAKKIFLTKIIKFGDEKISVSDFYNKAYFLRTILANGVNMDEAIDSVTRNELISGALSASGEEYDMYDASGWGTMDDRFVNLTKLEIDNLWCARNKSPLYHASIMFAIQKRRYLNGMLDSDSLVDLGINLSDNYCILDLINSITPYEGLWITKHFLVMDYMKLGKFKSEYDSEFSEFNNKLIKGATEIYNVMSGAYYKSYLDNQEGIDVSKEIEFEMYSHYSFLRYLRQCASLYMDNVFENMDHITECVYKSFNVGSTGDFMIKFIPSIKVVMYMLGAGEKTISGGMVVNFIDSILNFIDTNLYEGLYLNIKEYLKSQVMTMTRSAFAKVHGSTSVIKIGSGIEFSSLASNLTRATEMIDYMITNSDINNLFTYKDIPIPGSKSYDKGEWYEDVFGKPDIIFEYDDGRYDEIKKLEDSLSDKYKDILIERDKIYGTDEDGNRVEINKDNNPDIDISIVENMKDIIKDITSDKIVSNKNEISKLEKEIFDELKNHKPDFSKIKIWKDKISLLEKEINEEKSSINSSIIGSESEYHLIEDDRIIDSEIKIADLNSKNELALKYAILDEALNIAVENKTPLTNSELLGLLNKK